MTGEAPLEQEYEIVTANRKMLRVLESIEQAAANDLPVVLYGETGTGKQLAARRIHQLSSRRSGLLRKVNCATLSADVPGFEAELFAANEGTLFLMDVDRLPQFLQHYLFTRIYETTHPNGESRLHASSTNVRSISSTTENLLQLIDNGKFVRELYHYLSMLEISVPPLRERRDDIRLLALHFLQEQNRIHNKDLTISHQTFDLLHRYQWPGNVLELAIVIERSVALAEGSTITPDVLPDMIRSSVGQDQTMDESQDDRRLKTAVTRFESQYITEVLAEVNGDKKKAARILAISPASLYRKLEQFKKELGR